MLPVLSVVVPALPVLAAAAVVPVMLMLALSVVVARVSGAVSGLSTAFDAGEITKQAVHVVRGGRGGCRKLLTFATKNSP